MLGKTEGKTEGFTLIELLIVVAIIAILAAIAVPNFLEAQVRAKVSRCKSDVRSIATAIESYFVDYNAPPIDEVMWAKAIPDPPDGSPKNLITRPKAYSALTTPVAYMTTIPQDPFIDKGAFNASGPNPRMRYYRYTATFYTSNDVTDMDKKFKWRVYCKQHGFTWAIASAGPAKSLAGNFQKFLLGEPDQPTIYDPTNGTVSQIWIVRTNKGIMTYNHPLENAG
jgi:prepilin-type N-terminal cleavage/methylation domain-containing protein